MPPSYEHIEAELAIKSTLVEALNAENEQLRLLLQKHADAADARSISSSRMVPPDDMRRDSNVHELQAVIAHMRTQLYEHAADHDAQSALLASLRNDKTSLADEADALRAKCGLLQGQLGELTARYEEERQKVATLRNGMEESKRAISIMKDQLDNRRPSMDSGAVGAAAAAAAAIQQHHQRKISLSAHAHAPGVSEARRGSLNYLTGLGLTSKRLNHFDPRKQSPMMPSPFQAGPGLGAEEDQNFNPRASLPASAHALNKPDPAGTPANMRRRASLPANSTPHALLSSSATPNKPSTLGEGPAAGPGPLFATTSRRSSLTAAAGRRSSLGPDSLQRRNSNLAHTLMRLNAGQEDHDLPLARREAATIDEEEDGPALTQFPPRATPSRRGSMTLVEKRRGSVHLAPRRGSDLGGTGAGASGLLVDDAMASVIEEEVFSERSPALSARSARLARGASFPPREADGVVHALSLEAAMEISSLKDALAELKMQLFEAEESREASEACARALREFIASSSSALCAGGNGSSDAAEGEAIKLPPLPSDSESELEAEVDLAEQRKQKRQSELEKQQKQEKRSSRWGMPKLLPSLSYTSLRREASNSIADHLPAIASKAIAPIPVAVQQLTSPAPSSGMPPMQKKTTSSIDSVSELKPPTWRTTATLRSSVASGMSDVSTSGAPSPILSTGVPGFESTFSAFSFAARRESPLSEHDEPSSPTGGRDSPTFERDSLFDSASSADESDADSLPATPLDNAFGSRVEVTPQDELEQVEARQKGHSRQASDLTKTPRAAAVMSF